MSELTKELTIESFYEHDKMDPVKKQAIKSRLFQNKQEKKYQEKYIKKVMKKIQRKLRGVRPNAQGGWLVKTILSPDELEIFKSKGQGLYVWVTETVYKNMIKKGLSLSSIFEWLKFGQYGSKNNNKTPDETIVSEWKMNEPFVILWAYRLTDEDRRLGTDRERTAYDIEQIVNTKISNQIPRKDGSGIETFYTSLDKIKEEVKIELNKEELLIPYIPSANKEEAILKMINNKTKYFGLFATMRFGKSWCWFEKIKREYVEKNKVGIFVVFCHDTKVFNGWENKWKKSYKDCMDFVELKSNKDFDFNKTPIRNTLVVLSPQLITASIEKKDFPNFEEKLSALKKSYGIKCDELFVDESHNYFTPQWEKYYESICDGEITLSSGTACNIVLKHPDKFDELNTFFSGIKEFKKNLLEDLNIDLQLEVKLIQLSNSDGSDFNLYNLQNTDDGILTNQYHFEELVGKMLDPNSKFSPIFSRERKHHLALLDTVAACREFKRFILHSKYSDKIVPILVAGTKGRDAKNEKEVNKLILKAESEGKRTIVLSAGSMIQGVSERNWKSIINLSSKSTYEIYFQLFGRGFEFDNKLDNHIGEKTKVEKVIMWDYLPQRIYQVGSEFVDSMAKINGGDQTTALKYFHSIIDITEYVDERRTWTEPKKLEDIEYKINEIVNKNTIRRGLTVGTCLDKSFDIDGLDSTWTEWAIKQKWSSDNKTQKHKLDLWKRNLDKQKTDYSKSPKDNTERVKNEILDLRDQVKKSFEQTLSRLDIVWAVYKSEGKVDKHIDELFEYQDEDAFLVGLELPNEELSRIFVKTVKDFGLTDKINGKLKNSRIEGIRNYLDMDRETLISTTKNGIDKWFTYGGDDTQLSVENWIRCLEPWVKELKLKDKKNFVFPHAKSGSGMIALAYLLKSYSIMVFGKVGVTNEEIIELLSYEDENTFFEKLNNTTGFIKSSPNKKDFIIVNPPYFKHIEIFIKCFYELNDGGTLICIHPSTPFLNDKPTNKELWKTIRNIINENESHIKLFDGNKIFKDAEFFTPLSITTVKKQKNSKVYVTYSHLDTNNKKVHQYDSLSSVYIHGNDMVLDIKNKIQKKISKNLSEFVYRRGYRNNIYLKIVRVSGHPPKNGHNTVNPDFYQLIFKIDEFNYDRIITSLPRGKLKNKGALNEIGFDSIEHLKNGHSYLLTKFARFCVSLRKTGPDLNFVDLELVPYVDFSKEWNDEKLFDYFGLTQEERNFINEYIPNWYEYEQVIK